MSESWKHVSDKICEEEGRQGCNEMVPSFHPRSCDAPYEVLDHDDHPAADQCDGCGADEYEVLRDRKKVRCIGCGCLYAIVRRRGCEVVWA